MKSICIVILITVTCSSYCALFVNLGFESVDISKSQVEQRDILAPPFPFVQQHPFGTGTAEDLLPGWTVTIGEAPAKAIAVGNGFTDSHDFNVPSHVGLYVPGNYVKAQLQHVTGIGGKYALILDNENPLSIGGPISVN